MSVGSAGFHHPAVQAARLLHHKKHRLERRCFLVEGPALVAAALEAHVPLKQIFRLGGSAPMAEAQPAGGPDVELFEVDQRTLDSLAQTKTPQGVVGVAPFLHHDAADLPALVPAGPAVVLVLHDLSDPGNAGTLLRSAEAFGASAACFGPRAVDPYNDKVVRAAMGSLFRLPIVLYEEWAALQAAAAGAQLRFVAGEAHATDVRTVTLPDRVALLVGQERRGLRDVPPEAVLSSVGLPQRESVESLNAAVAGSILLYELSRARSLVKR